MAVYLSLPAALVHHCNGVYRGWLQAPYLCEQVNEWGLEPSKPQFNLTLFCSNCDLQAVLETWPQCRFFCCK